ncbi:MAG: hypothetical protein JWM56_229 [Candidatus Peribacteria bacterium]|nr:hypothetical protein [Candidatus Peribacteria bacterium]
MDDNVPLPGAGATPEMIPATVSVSDTGVPLDGIASGEQPTAEINAPAPVTAETVPPELMAKAKKTEKMLIAIGALAYILYGGWCAFLLATLPSANAGSKNLVSAGLVSCLVAAGILLMLVLIAMQRIAKADVAISRRKISLMKILIVTVPGILLSALVPLKITGQPPLWIDIVYPTQTEDFVAPLAVTFSVEKATATLREQNIKAIRYTWDFDGDGKPNDETVLPVTTGLYDQRGVFTVTVKIDTGGGASRTISRRLTIPEAVFSVSPAKPIVEQPVRLSVGQLLTDPSLLKEVTWDFDGDGTVDQTTKETDTVHTFYTTGRFAVTAVLTLANQSQRTLIRKVDVENPPPLPFPITLTTDPSTLVGPAPFGAGFKLETAESIKEVQWSFGDGKEEHGAQLLKVLHSFDKPGVYSVTAKVRSASGSRPQAELSAIVRVTQTLQLSDLHFTSKPELQSQTLSGEVPLTIHITPVTSVPLIEFSWETPGATTRTNTGATLEARYRNEGSYVVTLIAQDPEGRALRMPFQIQAEPPVPVADIMVRPDTGDAPLPVNFDASNSYIPPGQHVIGYEWIYGDEKQADSKSVLGVAHSTHLYSQPGEYTVTLRIVMANGTDVTTKRTVVVRKPSLSACIAASRVRVQAGGGIRFSATDCSTGVPTSFLWDVRSDADPTVVLAQSQENEYIHVFDTPGTYTVSLTLKDAWGQSKDSLSITVTP